MTTDPPPRVVIVGGGFGGLYAARALRKADVQVTLVDRRNFHLFQPLLYQVATGGLSPANIAAPLRAVLQRQANARVLLGEVTGFDLKGRQVLLRDGERLPFDTLVVAAGSRHHYFGHPEWEPHAPGLKSIEDATEIRARILLAFETAERIGDPIERAKWLTFVVVGGGPTGVELAGAVGELAHHTLRNNFRSINPASARILLLEAGDRILPAFPPVLSEKATRSLQRLGVTVLTKTAVTNVQANRVVVDRGGTVEDISCGALLWGAGVQASPLGRTLAEQTGAQLDRSGRVIVNADMTLPNEPNVFVLGDLANYGHHGDKPLPGMAPVAMQQGQFVADAISRRLRGKEPLPFRFRDRGVMATIGRNSAVADLGWVKFSGWLAWAAWLFIHLLYLIEFQNRLLVMMQWSWNYFTRNRAARLITGEDADAYRGGTK